MPGKPSRRVTRRQYWHRRLRAEKDPRGRFTLAAEYFRAMAAAGERAIPQFTAERLKTITDDLVAAADDLGARIPREVLERTGQR